jgi:hypothetical protein
MIIEVHYHILRALFAACAAPGDVRPYLHNLHVDTTTAADGKVTLVATDGSQMTWAEVFISGIVDLSDAAHESTNFAPINLAPRVDPHNVLVRLDTATGKADILSNRKARQVVLPRVEDRGVHAFPDWRRIAMQVHRAGAIDRVGLDFTKLSGVAEALNATSILHFARDASDPIKVEWCGKGCADIHSLLMPTRI